MELRERVRRRIERWRADPVLFCKEVLGIELWDGEGQSQAKVARAVATEDLVSVRSGQKVGKSTFDAGIALWAVALHPDWRVVFTAPASHQVGHILWPEFRRLYLGARVPLGGQLYKNPDKGLVYREGWEVFGLTTDKPERFAGISSRGKLIFIVDEASGFPESIFQAVFGNMAGGAKVILTGNPTRTSGTFFRSHKKGDSGGFKGFHISSLSTPNFFGGSIPGLATPWWLENVAKKQWGGPGNAAFDVRVLGEFPRQGSNAVIFMSMVEAARLAWERTPETGGLDIGVDVARYGDDESVIFPRRGYKALEPTILQGQDEVNVAGEVIALARRLRRSEEEIPRVKVDVIGPGGGVASILRRGEEVEVIELNVAENATAEGFHRLRDQLWFAGRDWLDEGGAIPPDDMLEAELVAPTYDFDTQGRYRVSDKEEIRSELGRSPDRADGLLLSIYNPPRDTGGVVTVRSERGR